MYISAHLGNYSEHAQKLERGGAPYYVGHYGYSQRGFVGFERRSGHAGRAPCDGIGRSGPKVSHASIRRRTRSNATITQLSQKRHALTQLFRKRNSERSGVDCGIHTDSLRHGHSCTCSDYHNTCLDTCLDKIYFYSPLQLQSIHT